MMQKVEVFGEVPLARFGHTITQGIYSLKPVMPIFSVEIKGDSIWRCHRGHRKVYNYWRHLCFGLDFIQMDKT